MKLFSFQDKNVELKQNLRMWEVIVHVNITRGMNKSSIAQHLKYRFGLRKNCSSLVHLFDLFN